MLTPGRVVGGGVGHDARVVVVVVRAAWRAALVGYILYSKAYIYMYIAIIIIYL